MPDQTCLLLFLGRTVAQRGGWGCRESVDYCMLLAQWEGKRRGIDHMCLLWSTIHLYELTRDRLTYRTVCPCVYLLVCSTKKEQQERGGRRDILKAMKHRSKHDSHLYWLFEHWVGGFAGLCWLINSLGNWLAPLIDAAETRHRLEGSLPQLAGLQRVYDSQRFRVMLVTHAKLQTMVAPFPSI